jgi:hypothetical protein
MLRKGFFVAAAAAIVTAGIATAARADISYTQEGEMSSGKTVTVTSARKGAERVEQAMTFGGNEMKTVTLTVCADRKIYTLDPALKLYTERPIKAATATGAAAAKSAAGTGAAGGKIVFTVGVKDLGKEQIGQYATRHYLITQRLQTSGCAGDMDNTSKMEVWVAPNAALTGTGCPELAGTAGLQGFGKQGCTCAIVQQGDVAAYRKAMDGLRVRTKMYSGTGADAAPLMTTEVKNVSAAKLPDALFSVPKDYKRVTEDEMNAAKQKAMMAKFQQPAAAGEQAGAND